MSIPCKVCSASGSAVLEDEALALYRCAGCGHVFKDIARENQEQYRENYFSEEHKNWFAHPDYPLFEFIYRQILRQKAKRDLKVLDIGCGRGDFLRYLRKKNPEFKLYGIDLSDNYCEGIDFIKGDILTDDPGRDFDVICNLAVIEHLDSPELLIQKIRKILLPDGIVFFTTDSDDSLIYSTARRLRKIGVKGAYERLYMLHHLQCFSNSSLRMLLEKNGFNLILQRNHNCPVAGVDYPQVNRPLKLLYMAAVRIIFFLSSLFNNGMLQIAVCKKDVQKKADCQCR